MVVGIEELVDNATTRIRRRRHSLRRFLCRFIELLYRQTYERVNTARRAPNSYYEYAPAFLFS